MDDSDHVAPHALPTSPPATTANTKPGDDVNALVTPLESEEQAPAADRSTAAVLGALLCLAVPINIVVALVTIRPDGRSYSGILFGAFVGFVFGQLMFASVVTVWARFYFGIRLFGGLLGAAFLAVCLGVFARNTRIEVVFIFAAACICQWLLYQFPLWIMYFRGKRLEVPTAGELSVQKLESQFGIQHILIWTSIVAVLAACGRAVDQLDLFGLGDTDITVAVYLMLGNSLVGLPLIYAVFVRQQLLAWILGAVLWGILVSVLQIWILARLAPMGSELPLFVAINVIQLATAGLLLGLYRACGNVLSST